MNSNRLYHRKKKSLNGFVEVLEIAQDGDAMSFYAEEMRVFVLELK